MNKSPLSRSFSAGVGEWFGQSEVYDPTGRFLGYGRDQRNVQRDPDTGIVTIDVTFSGPFELAGSYTIADHGTYRVYQGPLNYGRAEPIGDNAVTAHNYWPDLGLSQRFALVVAQDQRTQLSLAVISRGEKLRYLVVGESHRRLDEDDIEPVFADTDPAGVAEDLNAGRGAALLHRRGSWSGQLVTCDGDLNPVGTTPYTETVTAAGDSLDLAWSGLHFAADATASFSVEGNSRFSPAHDVVGSGTLAGGRAVSSQLLFMSNERRLWSREIARADGSAKAVIHQWFEGERRIGAAVGHANFESSSHE